ncbi:MAG: extracellular solute-binding protein [Candidatus Enteromonas sp.]|nr:extracellular solute-binding protein [Candidatus Enteromonas sp.]
MKKHLGFLLLAVSGLLISCGQTPGGEEPTSGVVKFSIINSNNERPGWDAQIAKANELMARDGLDIVIEKEVIKTDSWDDYYTKVAANLAGRTGGTIGRIAESHIPNMVAKGQLQDLTSIVTDLKATDEYVNESFDGVAMKDGKYYGLPSGTQHMVLYYNKTMIDEYNATHAETVAYPSGDWNNASTFAEIADLAAKLTSGEGEAKKFGLSAGPFLSYAGMYSKNSGGENIFDANGNPVINTQPFYDVYDWFDGMLKEDKSMPSTSDTQVASAINRFLNGNIAMFVDGIWQLREITEYTEFEVGVAAIPVKEKGYASYSTNFKDCFFAVKTSSHPSLDQTALRYLMKAEAVQALAEESVGGFPICKSVQQTYIDQLNKTKIKDYVGVITGGKERTVDVPYSTYYNQVDQRINQKMSSWITGKMTAHEFVDYMQEVMVKGMNGQL